jgi:hypothetical protein
MIRVHSIPDAVVDHSEKCQKAVRLMDSIIIQKSVRKIMHQIHCRIAKSSFEFEERDRAIPFNA